MAAFHIAVMPGDGIGIEVTAEAVRVLRAVAGRLRETRFHLEELPAGAGEYLKSGNPLPDATLERCRQADAILLGAMGLPEVRWPDGREMTPQIDLREVLDLYCGIRPVRLEHANDTPLKRYARGEIDFVVIRENTEGLFSARHSHHSHSVEAVEDVLRITRRGSERLFRAAFREADRRKKKVTLVDKANVLPSMVFFRQVFDEVAAEFPHIQTERIYVDAAALFLVQRPQSFDVLVTENMFGDILSDLAAGLVGGLGMAPSADLGDSAAVFQPVHGTAPDIAGRGIANPLAAIQSVALLFDWLGERETRRGARLIRNAVSRVLEQPEMRTRDLGGTMTTSGMGDAVLSMLDLQEDDQ